MSTFGKLLSVLSPGLEFTLGRKVKPMAFLKKLKLESKQMEQTAKLTKLAVDTKSASKGR